MKNRTRRTKRGTAKLTIEQRIMKTRYVVPPCIRTYEPCNTKEITKNDGKRFQPRLHQAESDLPTQEKK